MGGEKGGGRGEGREGEGRVREDEWRERMVRGEGGSSAYITVHTVLYTQYSAYSTVHTVQYTQCCTYSAVRTFGIFMTPIGPAPNCA